MLPITVNFIAFVFDIVILFFFLFTFIRAFFLGKKIGEFKCLRCGKCCTLRVTPTEDDIKRIEELGFTRKGFMQGRYIKRINKACLFLKKKNKLYCCRIYKFRPNVCRSWPFSGFFKGRFVFAKTFNCPGLGINRKRY